MDAAQPAKETAAPQPAPQGGKGPGGKKAPVVRPVASPMRLRRRHFGLLAGFLALVILPTILVGLYLALIAQDSYASRTGFTVRTEETGSASELIGGLGSMFGASTGSGNSEVLNEFVLSQEMALRADAQLDLVGHFSEGWWLDPVFLLPPNPTHEALRDYWARIVRITFDRATGLMDVQARARTPEMAQRIAQVVVAESEAMINALNEQARRDSMANAERDLEAALDRLRSAREALSSFRARTQIVDPQADIQGRMGVINLLQQQLAQALVDYDLLLQTTQETDPRVRQAERRIEVIRERITSERRNFATQDVTVFDTDYPRLIAQYESLRVDQEFAERTYTAALTALDQARSNAQRQSLYLATYIRPTLAQEAEYPERMLLTALTFGFLLLTWSILALVYYSIRDRG